VSDIFRVTLGLPTGRYCRWWGISIPSARYCCLAFW